MTKFTESNVPITVSNLFLAHWPAVEAETDVELSEVAMDFVALLSDLLHPGMNKADKILFQAMLAPTLVSDFRARTNEYKGK